MEVILLATCPTCPGALALRKAAIKNGYDVVSETVEHSDDRTLRSAMLGIGLPVLIREDGAMSDDGRQWLGTPPVKGFENARTSKT